MASKERLYLIDGSGFIFRAYYALPPLNRPDGTPVGAVLGFCNMMVKLLNEMNAQHIAIVFDAARKTFRNDIYPAYKANRSETPEDLIPQFKIIRHACQAFGVPFLEEQGFEADDVIATYMDKALANHMEVTIVSSDKDLMQLIQKDVKLFDPLKSIFIDGEKVQEKFGVPPEQVIDVQALAGDTSDNIPGVPGIGVKTAAQLIQEFKTLENLLKNTDKIPQVKRRELLETHADLARISKKLVTLNHHAPLAKPLGDLKPHLDQETLRTFLQEQGFKTLENRLFGKSHAPTPHAESHTKKYTTITTLDDLKGWVKKLSALPIIGFDTETDDLNAMRAQLVGMSFAAKAGEACYIPLQSIKDPGMLFDFSSSKGLDVKDVLTLVKPLLENPTIQKVGHNIKYDKLVLKKYALEVKGYQDSMLLSYLLNDGRQGLDLLVEEHFHHKMTTFKELTGSGKTAIKFNEVPLDKATVYAAEDADYTLRLYHLFYPQLSSSLKKLYEEIDLPLVDTLIHMEEAGIKIDEHQLQSLAHMFDKKLHQLEKEIFKMAGTEFNVGSPKQLGEILFDKLKLGQGKKSKTGAYVTDSDTLEDLSGDHPLPEKVLEWRQISKLKSTYTETLIRQINPKTHRIHTSYGMAITSTGRLSSSDPNLQNIPIRSEEGQKIRHCFVADKGNKLVSFDYSQIELRLLAHFAHIPSLEQAFKEGVDIHALTASQVFNVPLKDITPEIRSKAKAINFGIIYGISAFGLAKQLKIGRDQASQYIKMYHAQYPGITEFMKKTIDFAKEHNYVETLWGRHCYVPNISSKNGSLRSFAERQAINAPLQGTNADLIKKAMIQIDEWLREKKLKTKMLLQVHDELIFEAPESEVDKILKPIESIMTGVCKLKVPLVVGIGIGDNWQDTHKS
ncbi:MAG: DNA polymerase I [Alphaproteobacteria bacterium]